MFNAALLTQSWLSIHPHSIIQCKHLPYIKLVPKHVPQHTLLHLPDPLFLLLECSTLVKVQILLGRDHDHPLEQLSVVNTIKHLQDCDQVVTEPVPVRVNDQDEHVDIANLQDGIHYQVKVDHVLVQIITEAWGVQNDEGLIRFGGLVG